MTESPAEIAYWAFAEANNPLVPVPPPGRSPMLSDFPSYWIVGTNGMNNSYYLTRDLAGQAGQLLSAALQGAPVELTFVDNSVSR